MSDLKIDWCSPSDEADTLARFFVEHVSADYISHVEIQMGRALSPAVWSDSLLEQVREEFTRAILDDTHALRALAAYDRDHLVGVAIVSFHPRLAVPYAVVDDLIVHPDRRSLKLGTRILAWIEDEARRAGLKHLFLETGTQNERARGFFQSCGFAPCSVVMQKTLTTTNVST